MFNNNNKKNDLFVAIINYKNEYFKFALTLYVIENY